MVVAGLKVMAENTEGIEVSRRDFLILSWVVLSAWWLAACSGGSLPPAPTRRPTRTPEGASAPPAEIKGPVPGEYSQFIRESELIPTVFTDFDTPENRIQMGITYLTRYRDALQNLPQQHGRPLADYHINTPDNYPISIPGNPEESANNWNVFDVINTFLNELKSGKLTVVYNSAEPVFVGTVNSYELHDGKWLRKTEMRVGKKLMEQTYYHESSAFVYTKPTDAELAVALLHDYAHALQDEMVLAYLNNDPGALQEIGYDPARAAQWISKKGEELGRDRAKALLPPDLVDEVKLNEAQANVLANLFLYSLNQLNASEHFPGTRRIDPTDADVQAIRDQNPGLHYLNLYTLFVQEVIGGNNALSPAWVRAAGK